MTGPSRVLLIGMMGAGKSTTGHLLAARLGWPFLDSDDEVTRLTGRTIPEIWKADGEAAFRAEESRVLAAATTSDGPVVIGVAGGPDKCDYARETLGFDACLDHYDAELPQRLAAACPKGIDVYFESVGGEVLAAVIPLLNRGARMPLCGLIAWYNLAKLPTGVDRTPQLLFAVLKQRLKIQGFIIFDHYDRMGAFHRDMTAWMRDGHVKYREEVIVGLENAPQGLMGLLLGKNFGKLVVRVSEG